MAEPRVYRAEALVLRQRRLGEADRILALYTLHKGRLDAVAKGVLKPTSHLAGHLEPLTHVSLLLARGRELAIITQAQGQEIFPHIRRDLHLLGLACYACELVARLTPFGEADPPVFHLLLDALRRLESGEEAGLALRCLEVRLLTHLGYGPELFRCARCQEPLLPRANGFSPAAGGALCPSCASQDPAAQPLSLNALKVLRLWQRQGFDAARLRLALPLAGELEEQLHRYLLHVLEQEMRSRAFLKAVGG